MGKHPVQIIDEQVRRWSHLQAQVVPGESAPRHWPVITISREFGARGAELAQVLARQTGFAVWDRELVQAVAEESGADRRIMETLDERCQRVIEDTVHSVLRGTSHTNLQYLRSLMRVVHALGRHGGHIIVGRGANYICRQEALRIRVVCALEQWVRRLAEQQHLDPREARRLVVQRDAERADFVRQHFHREIADPLDYDLVLNAGTQDVHQLAAVVMQAYEARVGARPHAVREVLHA